MRKLIFGNDTVDTFLHMLFGFALFTLLGYYIPKIYFTYFDNTEYYKITNPITLERKETTECSFVDAYINRTAIVPIKGSAVRQLTLIRIDGKFSRVANFETPIQADIGTATMIAHWKLPCDIPLGSYFFEGTVEYKVRDISKYTHFYTENFKIIASSSASIHD